MDCTSHNKLLLFLLYWLGIAELKKVSRTIVKVRISVAIRVRVRMPVPEYGYDITVNGLTKHRVDRVGRVDL